MFFVSTCCETQGSSCRHWLRLFSIYVSINKHNSYKEIPDASREKKVDYSRGKPSNHDSLQAEYRGSVIRAVWRWRGHGEGGGGGKDGAVVGVFASHQCSPAKCGLSLMSVLVPNPRVSLRFSSLH